MSAVHVKHRADGSSLAPRIIKIGGSILASPQEFARVAQHLNPILKAGPVWVVVSAARGVTETLRRIGAVEDESLVQALLAAQAECSGTPPSPTLEEDLKQGILEARTGKPGRLHSWGERASAVALQVRLMRAGLEVPVVELAARTRPPGYRNAIVPGFYLRDRNGNARTLPRGGSDISALLVASWLGSPTVHLWKDGGGIHVGGGASVASISADNLLERLGTTIHPLHPAAVRIAQRNGISLLLEDPWDRSPATWVRPAISPDTALEGAPQAAP